MFLILLQLLQKYDYNINKTNIKYFLKDLYEEDRSQDFLVKSQIKNLLEDVDNSKREEQYQRLEEIRKSERNRWII